MIQILNKDYSQFQPALPSKNAIAVFNLEDAKIVLSHSMCHFVVALKEETMEFRYCHNMVECERYYNNEE